MFETKSNRRLFIKQLGTASASISLYPATVFSAQNSSAKKPFLVMVKNGSPAEMVKKALEPLGGMAAFIKKGQTVIVKPNMSWDRRPEQGANTNPEVVAETVKLAIEAGAKQVRVFDRTCNEKRRCYKRSGIEAAAKQAGARVYHVNERKYKNVALPNGKRIKNWDVYEDVLKADVIINLPVLKQHSTTQISIGIKNLMGFMGGDRGKIHRNFDVKIIDFVEVIKPHLTIIDATRVLMRNGPQGGNLDDVQNLDTIIASGDMVAADALAAGLMKIESTRLNYLVEAEKRGLGIINIDQMEIQTIDLG